MLRHLPHFNPFRKNPPGQIRRRCWPFREDNLGRVMQVKPHSLVFTLKNYSDGNFIRLNIPPKTEERRIELVKVVSSMTEKTRVSIRNVREEIW